MLNTSGKAFIIFLLLLAALGAGGWYYWTYVRTTPIGDITKDPRQYERKQLAIAGKVTEQNSLVVVKYFRLRDKTGEIVVVTDRYLPNIGDQVRVEGSVHETFNLGQIRALVFREQAGK